VTGVWNLSDYFSMRSFLLGVLLAECCCFAFSVVAALSISCYNDVNNQQDATTSSFINLFKSALHVSGKKFTHPQEHFLTLYTYTACGTMHRSAAVSVHCTKSCIQSKSAPEDGRICHPKHVGLN